MNAFSSLLMSLSLISTAAPVAAQPWSVTFVIDMKARIAAKTFDPAKDAVGVRGGFAPLGWNVTTPALDPDGDGLYEVTVVFPKRPFGGQPATYKFKAERLGAAPNDGWEEGRNRLVSLDATAQTVRRVFDEPPPPIVAAHSGTLRSHPAFASRFLGPRDVIVYLPPGYEKEPKRRYPVLYLHDGQNLFDAEHAGMEWQVDETAERLIRAGAIEPLIVVGIANTDARWDEYTPTRVDSDGGKADLYGRLIVEELKPFVDRTYRTRPVAAATGIGGASLGGLVSLYLGLKYPDVFGTVFAVSPHVWWDHGVILKTVAALPKKSAQRIWVDVGTGEGEEYLDGVRRLRGALIAKGWKIGKELAYVEDEGAQHDELAWAARVEPMLRWAVGSPHRPLP
jgi:predicted alpha/beta superfamily hydrolase